MAKIKNVQPLVYQALEYFEETRNDDFLLIYHVLKHFVTSDLRLDTVLKHHVELGIPSFASIIRIRRILQKKYPHLEGKKAKAVRQAEETEFRQYALDNKY